MTIQGTITAIDENGRTFTLKGNKASAETITFKVSARQIKILTVGENVIVNYTAPPSGEKEIFYIERVKEPTPK